MTLTVSNITRRFVSLSLGLFAGLALSSGAIAQDMELPASVAEVSPENVLVIELTSGPVYVELLPEVAPEHVARIQTLSREGFYDGIVFHRVIEGFMAQTGDPTGTGTGGSDYADLPAEFSDIAYERGVLGMARTSNPNSANSQFFIMFAPAPSLNNQYTVFGRVLDGMDHVDAIKKGDPRTNGMVEEPDAMIRARLLADLNG